MCSSSHSCVLNLFMALRRCLEHAELLLLITTLDSVVDPAAVKVA